MKSLVDLPIASGPAVRLARRVTHLLYARGFHDAALMRGWVRWSRWREKTRRGRIGELVMLPLAPVRAWRMARRAVEEHGRAIEAVHGVPRHRQLAQLWWLRIRHGMECSAYLAFQLHQPQNWRRADRFLEVESLGRIYRLLIRRTDSMEEVSVLSDKYEFEQWCRANSVRCVSSVAIIRQLPEQSGTAEIALPLRDLVSKPTQGQSGYGIRLWRHDGNGGYIGSDGRSRTPDELLRELRGQATATVPILLQERLYNHSALRSLTTGALASVRLMTYRTPEGTIEALDGIYKLPVGGAVVDNVSHGATVARVRLATGTLGKTVSQVGAVFRDVERHPDTGVQIDGIRLPYWTEAVDLVKRVHRAFPRTVVLGWDVAILEDGPVLIEANTRAGSGLMQFPGDPLADTPLLHTIHRHLRASYGF